MKFLAELKIDNDYAFDKCTQCQPFSLSIIKSNAFSSSIVVDWMREKQMYINKVWYKPEMRECAKSGPGGRWVKRLSSIKLGDTNLRNLLPIKWKQTSAASLLQL